MELLDFNKTPISQIKDRFSKARYDASMLVKAALETVEDVTKGKAILTDPTNPAVMLMEMSAIQTANAIHENVALLRKQYSSLAMDDEELYLHMSDEDYLNRFAVPVAPVKFTFSMLLENFIGESVYDPNEHCKKIVFPRDTTITVDGTVFSLLYPIELRRYENGVIQITYNGNIHNPVHRLTNTILEPIVRKDTNQVDWLFFTAECLQVRDQTEYFVIDKIYNFKKEIVLVDKFYYARAFYKDNSTQNRWIELKTTHTDQVFDPNEPTVVFKVLEKSLIVEIPVVYTSTGRLNGELRVDVYTTKGDINMNLANYRTDLFDVEPKAIDQDRDINEFTNALARVSYHCYSTENVTGGRRAISYEEMRERVIFNTVGPQQLPITNVQLVAEANNSGFDIVREIDVLTNRVYLATRKLPAPVNPKLITPANLGVVSYTTDGSDLKDHYKCVHNGDRITILSKAYWRENNGRLSLLSKNDLDQLEAMGQTAMVNQINSNSYFYNPFYYVLNAEGDEYEVQAYSLDQPKAKTQSFIRQNHTLQLFVNTGSYHIEKTPYGYALRVSTYSGDFYKDLPDNSVGIQLAFKPDGEAVYAYINGVLEGKTETDERIYRFDIYTNHDVDPEHRLCITNASIFGLTAPKLWVKLTTEFNLLHWTSSLTSNYRSDETDMILGKFMLPASASGNSHELLQITFGHKLTNLWRRSRSYLKEPVYKRYDANIPLYYENDIYEQDPVTGSTIKIEGGQVTRTRRLHQAGDVVRNTQGDIVYKYKVGEIVYDEKGMPIVEVSTKTGREIDILVVDGRYLFADDIATKDYVVEIDRILTDWIVDDVDFLQNRLLDQTNIFFYPKSTMGTILAYSENQGQVHLSAEQSFTVDLYVRGAIYRDEVVRDRLKKATITVIDNYISNTIVNMTELRDRLKEAYQDSVEAFDIRGLGGSKDYQVLRVSDEKTKFCLKKNLIIQSDKSMFVEDDVEVTFSVVD